MKFTSNNWLFANYLHAYILCITDFWDHVILKGHVTKIMWPQAEGQAGLLHNNVWLSDLCTSFHAERSENRRHNNFLQ